MSGSSSYPYPGQLAVSLNDNSQQWNEGDYQRVHSSSVSPRETGYCSKGSSPNSAAGEASYYASTNNYVSTQSVDANAGAYNTSSSSTYFFFDHGKTQSLITTFFSYPQTGSFLYLFHK